MMSCHAINRWLPTFHIKTIRITNPTTIIVQKKIQRYVCHGLSMLTCFLRRSTCRDWLVQWPFHNNNNKYVDRTYDGIYDTHSGVPALHLTCLREWKIVQVKYERKSYANNKNTSMLLQIVPPTCHVRWDIVSSNVSGSLLMQLFL